MHRGGPATRWTRRDGYRNTRIGSRCGCRVGRNKVFRGRKRFLLHHQCNRGGHPGCASRLNVDPAHSLPQQRSAGRNLITVFFTVNYPHATFFAELHVGCAGNASCTCSGIDKPRYMRCARANAHAEKHREKSFIPIRSTSTAPGDGDAHRHDACATAREKKMSPTMKSDAFWTRVPAWRASICANNVDADGNGFEVPSLPRWSSDAFLQRAAHASPWTRPEGNPWRFTHTSHEPAAASVAPCRSSRRHRRVEPETAAHGGRPASSGGGRISARRFPAARHSRPGRAVRSPAPPRTSRRRTASLRRRRPR